MNTVLEIIEGLKIIQTREPNSNFAVQHDKIMCGNSFLIKESSLEGQQLIILNWFIDEEYESWAKFV